MKTIYVIAKEHEDTHDWRYPAIPYLSLATNGEEYNLGEPLPAFQSEEEAEKVRKEWDKYGRHKVVPLSLV